MAEPPSPHVTGFHSAPGVAWLNNLNSAYRTSAPLRGLKAGLQKLKKVFCTSLLVFENPPPAGAGRPLLRSLRYQQNQSPALLTMSRGYKGSDGVRLFCNSMVMS